jgi:hypothetical protein
MKVEKKSSGLRKMVEKEISVGRMGRKIGLTWDFGLVVRTRITKAH